MDSEMLELELEKLEKRGINRYKAVVMASQEARLINDQMRLDIINAGSEKPTTMALKRLFEGRVIESETGEVES